MATKGTLKSLFGKRLRELRKRRGWSQEKLALLSGCNISYLGMIERGKRSVSIRIIEKIARALRIQPMDLFDLYSVRDTESRRSALQGRFQSLVRDNSLHDMISVSLESIDGYRRNKKKR
ncbi:MAG: hypothetical protein A2Z34_05795 [Planctomycetes bacterium RBG_16_59_8]|nr:MAG: hypothetical protein A2Z34_05795 [Planctomycetes bacterium RBG_16_59_8]